MAITTVNYSANQTITMDLTSLANSTTLLAGRESLQINNTTDKYLDCLVQGTVTVGAGPITSNSVIAVYVWGSDAPLSSTNKISQVLEGADGARTIANLGLLFALRLGATVSVTATTANLTYDVLPFSVASLFGGVMPKYWGLWVTTNSGTLSASNNTNKFEYVGIKYDITA